MARPINIVLIYKDGKGNEGQSLINIVNQDEESDIAQQIEAAVQHQIFVDALTGCQIVRCGLLIDVPIDVSLKSTPESTSDLEEGAEFIFRADNTFTSQIRIPGFLDSKFVSASPEVDLTDSDVLDFVDSMTDGLDGGSGLLDVQSSRGDDLTTLASAKKSFQKSRV